MKIIGKKIRHWQNIFSFFANFFYFDKLFMKRLKTCHVLLCAEAIVCAISLEFICKKTLLKGNNLFYERICIWS